jgi:hypothetical protein
MPLISLGNAIRHNSVKKYFDAFHRSRRRERDAFRLVEANDPMEPE